MTADQQVLHALAERAGIVVEYRDATGEMHGCDDAVLYEMLDALEIPDPGRQDPQRAGDAIEDASWASPLPPIMVLRHPAYSFTVRVRLPESRVDQRLRWRLLEESGQEHGGSFRPADLPRVEQRTVDAVPHVGCDLDIAEALPPGYHQLELLQARKLLGSMPLVLAPRTCYDPDAVREGRRVWGPSVPLHALRSERNWGIGDIGDLRHLLTVFADLGADIVGLSPLHALYLGNPNHADPYRPSSRSFVNPLYLDVEAIPDYTECAEAQDLVHSAEFQVRLEWLRAAEMVNYPGVTAAKREVFELLYRHFAERHLGADTMHARAFRDFQRTAGRALRRFALFEALWEHLNAENPRALGWLHWPAMFRHPESPAVRAFEQSHTDRIEFFEYLQWLADQQLFALGERSVELGLGVGLYLSLAVSVDPNGADAWAEQECYALDIELGAPPDDSQSARAELGAAADAPAAAAQPRLRAIHRGAARPDARGRCLALPPRRGTVATVLDSARPRPRAGGLRRQQSGRALRHPGAGKRTQPLPDHRRRPRRGPRSGSRCDAPPRYPRLPIALPQQDRRWRIRRGIAVPAGFAGHGRETRHADARRVLAGTGSAVAQSARPVRVGRAARRAGGAARAGPGTAAARPRA